MWGSHSLQMSNLDKQMRLKSSRAVLVHVPLLIALLALSGCAGSHSDGGTPGPQSQRIYHNPYGQVAWGNDLRLKAQHHDHVAVNLERIGAYDRAGYDV